MPVVNTNIIKEWFRTLKKPTEDQFWAWLDSFRHKWEKVPLDDVDGLPKVLQDKADLVNGVVPEEQLPFSIKTSEVLAIGAITASENSVSVGLHASGKNRVRLAGVIYERSFANNFMFAPVVNYYKILIVYALPEPGLFFLAEGAEALEAIEPELPEGAFVIRRIVVSTTGQIIEPETATGLKYAEEDGWRNINLTEVLTILPYSYDLRSSYHITSGVANPVIGGIRNALIDRNASPSWDGKEFWIYNATGGDLLLDSEAVTDDDVFPLVRSITLKAEQSCKLKLRRDALEVVGVMSSGELPDLSAYALNADLNTEIVNRAAADLLEKNERTAADALKVDKPTTDGIWSLQKLGSVFTWVSGVVQNIANTDLTNLSARIFTQGNTFTWNTAGFFHYLKGLLDKTGNAAYTKVVVVHPTTGEMVTRDFADPQATTLAVQNASASQKTAMRTALLGTATPASPVLNNAFPSFIKIGEQTEIELIGLNLTLIDPTSIYIINPIDSSKIFAQSYYNRTGLIITTVWTIPNTVPEGIYDIKIDLGVVAQGLSTAKLKVVSAVTAYNLLASQFIAKTKNNDPIVKTYAVSDNYIQLSGEVTGINYPTPLGIEGVITVKTANILDGSKNWLIMADVMVPTYAAGAIEPLAPAFGVTQTTDAEFTNLSSIMTSISVNGNAQNLFHNGTTAFNVQGTGSGGTAYYNIILEKTGQDVVFKMKRSLPGGVTDVMTKTLTGLIDTSKMYALFFHEGGSNSNRKITNYTFLKIYQS